MINWLKRLWTWIKESGLTGMSLIALFPLLAWTLFWPTPTEFRLRLVGLIVQLCGVGTVAKGLSDTRKLFGRPSAFQSAWQWFRRFPPFSLKPINIYMQGIVSAETVGRPTVWINIAPATSVEQRLSALESNLIAVNQKTIELQNQMNGAVGNTEKALAEERNSREQTDQQIQRKLELTETGGLHLSIVGIIWLCCGLVLATMPNEIVQLFF